MIPDAVSWTASRTTVPFPGIRAAGIGYFAFSLTRAPAELRASPSVSAGRRLTRGPARDANRVFSVFALREPVEGAAGALDPGRNRARRQCRRLVVGRLVSLTVNEPVTKVRESALNSISEAFNHHRLPLDLVEPLDTDAPTMEPELLAHAVCIFDATHNPQARQLIEPSSTTPTLTWARKPAAQRPRS